jgi:hypothetical protein
MYTALQLDLHRLLAYEHRLADARTWPYSTAMLRTLFLSVLAPVLTALARTLIDRFY